MFRTGVDRFRNRRDAYSNGGWTLAASEPPPPAKSPARPPWPPASSGPGFAWSSAWPPLSPCFSPTSPPAAARPLVSSWIPTSRAPPSNPATPSRPGAAPLPHITFPRRPAFARRDPARNHLHHLSHPRTLAICSQILQRHTHHCATSPERSGVGTTTCWIGSLARPNGLSSVVCRLSALHIQWGYPFSPPLSCILQW